MSITAVKQLSLVFMAFACMMTQMDKKQLFEKAKAVLDSNWVDLGNGRGFTKPAHNIYPYQWNWDSGFIAYGYVQYDTRKAIEELRSLFSGQWKNGMLPHIIFHETDPDAIKTYFPSPDMWHSHQSPDAPDDVATSGLIQPPLQAMAVWRIFKHLNQHDRQAAAELLEEFYPKLLKQHEYLHTVRDPEETGLVTIFHPWESGLDNSPRWDAALRRVEPVDMSQYKRMDTNFINKKNRPSDDDYGRYLALMFALGEHNYDITKCYDQIPFRIKDLVFSSILYMANRRLWRMGEVLSKNTDMIDHWMSSFESNLFKYCWHEDEHMFFDWDLVEEKQITLHTVASLLPIATGVMTRRQMSLVRDLLSKTEFCGEQACMYKLAPSLPLTATDFNHELYWRGPIWINMNWFLWKGFLQEGMEDAASDLQEAMLTLMDHSGFREYYSPITGEGLGAEDFSWSAALAIDLLQ